MIEKSPIKFLISYIKKYFPYFIIFILFNITSNYINDITIPKYIGLIIESIKANFNYFDIQNLLLLVVVYNVLYIVFDVFTRCFYILSFTKTKNNIIKTLFYHVEQYELSFFNSNLSGSIGNKIIDLANLSERFLFNLINIVTVNLILKVCILYSFYKINTSLAIINLSWIILYISIIFCLNKYFKIRIKNYEEQKNKINGTVIDVLLNVINIKLFSRETYELYLLNNNLKLSYKKESSSIFMKIFIKLVCNILSSLPLIINLWLSLYLYKLDSLNVGNIVYIVITSLNIIQTTKFIGNIIIENLEQYNKIKYNLENIVVNPTIINYTDKLLTLTTSSITFSNISFQYSNNSPLVFNKLNLSIPSNQKIGIVGYSGAGKSTLINLLMRFFDIEEGKGSIEIDGQDIRDVTQESLRQNISYIPQDPILFHRTIGENIAYGKLNATEEEIIEASKKANCYEFINNLENKFDTLVGERGVKLSGGQRQRIAIARAILKNSKILILDEATSALDSITEKEIQEALKNLMENKTVIAVAHRLSTLDNMDRIIVLDKGKIVEDGTKQELLKNKDGLFSKMWEMQKGGFIE